MTKANAKQTRATESTSLTLAKWTGNLKRAAKSELSAAAKVYWAVIEARGAFDVSGKAGEKQVREAAKAAFEGAGMEKRSVQKRVSDTMAILKAPSIPGDAPENLQRCADAIRANRPDNDKRKPRQSKGPDATQKGQKKAMGKADVVHALQGSIDGLRKRAADDETVALLDSLAAILHDDA